MKNVTIIYGHENAPDKRKLTIDLGVAVDVLLKRKNTVLAGVLAHLLKAGPLTALDGVKDFRTRHLDVTIRTLKKEYGWPIESIEIKMYKPDGTIFYVTGYELSVVAIFQAFLKHEYLSDWLKEVDMEQVRKRASDEAKAAAFDSYRISKRSIYFQAQ